MPRRYDPTRRERLVEAALRVLARDGVAATTHRRVAAEADVPLGSTTYHFHTLDDLVEAAFERHVDGMAERFEARMRAAEDPGAAVEGLVDAALVDLTESGETLALTYELYGAAARRPAVKALTEGWMARAHAALRLHFDAETAKALDVALEGFMVHISISSRPPSRAEIRETFRRLLVGSDSARVPVDDGPPTT